MKINVITIKRMTGEDNNETKIIRGNLPHEEIYSRAIYRGDNPLPKKLTLQRAWKKGQAACPFCFMDCKLTSLFCFAAQRTGLLQGWDSSKIAGKRTLDMLPHLQRKTRTLQKIGKIDSCKELLHFKVN